MGSIGFKARLSQVNSIDIVLLPKSESAKFPSRGMVYVKGTINNYPFQSELEPDGRGSHWLQFTKAIKDATHAKLGDTLTLLMEPTKDVLEPHVPEDLKKSLASSPEIFTLWKSVTPMARWDWIRWVGSTKNPETRAKRISVELSKLKKGTKRPCCFNRSMCCDPRVSQRGVLLV